MTLLRFLLQCDANFYAQYAVPLIAAHPQLFDLDGLHSSIDHARHDSIDTDFDHAFGRFEQDSDAQYELHPKFGRYVWDIADQWYQKWNVVFSLEHMGNWTPTRKTKGESDERRVVFSATNIQPWLDHIALRHCIHPDHRLLLERLCLYLVTWHQANRPLALLGACKLNSIPFFPPSWFVDKEPQRPGRCKNLAPSYMARFVPPYRLVDARVPERWDSVFLKGLAVDPNHQFDIDPGLIATTIPIHGLTVHYDPMLGHSQLMMVMKKATFGNLETSLKTEIPTDYRKPRQLALSITKGVKDLHWEYIHGNVHPRNILLDWADYVGELVDMTFLQRSSAHTKPQPQGCCGRWPYVAPEVASTGLSTAADIYALGIILWQLVSRVTFPDEALVVDPDLYRIEPIPGVLPEWEALYTDCLHTDPARRPNAYTIYRRLERMPNAPFDPCTLAFIHQRRALFDTSPSSHDTVVPALAHSIDDHVLPRLVHPRPDANLSPVQNLTF